MQPFSFNATTSINEGIGNTNEEGNAGPKFNSVTATDVVL